MSALLRRRRAHVITYVLGRTALGDVAAAVLDLLRDPAQPVVVNVTGFDYFDEHELLAVADIAIWSSRVRIVGLDRYVDRLLPPASANLVDVRPRAERAVSHLSAATVVTGLVDSVPLDDHHWAHALAAGVAAGRAIVTVDLRHLDRLSPAQLLALAETSGDLARDHRTLMLVNASTTVADQVRGAGLSGGLRMNIGRSDLTGCTPIPPDTGASTRTDDGWHVSSPAVDSGRVWFEHRSARPAARALSGWRHPERLGGVAHRGCFPRMRGCATGHRGTLTRSLRVAGGRVVTIRVVLVDDTPSHLELLRLLVELDDDLELVGVAVDGEAGVALAAELQPDLIVSDIEMPRLDGLRAVPGYRAAAPAAAVVLMSSRPPGDAAAQARAAGADAYIDKGTGVDTTISMFKAIVADVTRPAAGYPVVVDLREPDFAAHDQAARGSRASRAGRPEPE